MENNAHQFEGPGGTLEISPDDKVALKLAMLIEGQCGKLPVTEVAAKYGFSRAHYYRVLGAYREKGCPGLVDQKKGPTQKTVRTPEANMQIIRHKFLDPKASTKVIAQRLNQTGYNISVKSVDRTIKEFGLQKKTPHLKSRKEKKGKS